MIVIKEISDLIDKWERNHLKEFNINNNNKREILCVQNEDNAWGGLDNASKYLIVGKIYHVNKVEVRSWHTRVYLDEFPSRWFNSVSFNEI